MATNNKKILGWHFLPASMLLEYYDGRKAEVGKTLSMTDAADPKCCSRGMHASKKPSQAATFNKGPVLTRVEVSGDIDEQHDKFAGRNRKVLWAKKLSDADIKKCLKSVGYSYNDWSSTSTLVSNLASASGSSAYSDKVDKWLISWAKKNGLVEGTVSFVKPEIDEKTIISLLNRRVVRTEKEIKKDLGDTFDMSNWDDVFDNAANDMKVLIVDDYEKNGNAGYLLSSSAR